MSSQETVATDDNRNVTKEKQGKNRDEEEIDFSSLQSIEGKKKDEGGRDGKNATTAGETMIHLLKGNIGPGILNMPEAFLHSGLYVGLIGVPVIGFICLHCMQLLLESSRLLCERTKSSNLSYEETAEVAFQASPYKNVQKYAQAVKYTMMTFLCITQLGFCCVYFVFVSQNLYQAIECMAPSPSGISILGYMSIILPFILLMCYISELKHLSVISLIACIVQTIGFIITFYYLVRDLGGGVQELPFFAGWKNMPLYFSSAVYAFEGIGLILPLENKMKRPEMFGGTFGVLNSGFGIVIGLFAAVGYFGYLQYGEDVAGSITLNLPPGELLAQCVKLLMALAVFLTYPIQFYVPAIVLGPPLMNLVSSKKAKIAVNFGLKTFMVLMTYTLAALIPNIGLFINLVGAISSTTLALIFPPIVHLVTIWPDRSKGRYVTIKAGFIVLFGLAGFVTGTYSSVLAIVDYLSSDHELPPLVCE